jgi:hypothetical protein
LDCEVNSVDKPNPEITCSELPEIQEKKPRLPGLRCAAEKEKNRSLNSSAGYSGKNRVYQAGVLEYLLALGSAGNRIDKKRQKAGKACPSFPYKPC